MGMKRISMYLYLLLAYVVIPLLPALTSPYLTKCMNVLYVNGDNESRLKVSLKHCISNGKQIFN